MDSVTEDPEIPAETNQEAAAEPGSADLYRIRDASTGQDVALRLASDEQLDRLHPDLYAQYQGYKAQAAELSAKSEQALSGANLVAYELDRRRRTRTLNGGAVA